MSEIGVYQFHFKVWSIVWKQNRLWNRHLADWHGDFVTKSWAATVSLITWGCWLEAKLWDAEKNMWKGLKLKGRRELHASESQDSYLWSRLEISGNLSAPPVQKCLLYLGMIQKRGWNKGMAWSSHSKCGTVPSCAKCLLLREAAKENLI